MYPQPLKTEFYNHPERVVTDIILSDGRDFNKMRRLTNHALSTVPESLISPTGVGIVDKLAQELLSSHVSVEALTEEDHFVYFPIIQAVLKSLRRICFRI